MRKILFVSVLFFAACSDTPVENQSDSTIVDSVAIMKDTTLPKPASKVLDTVQPPKGTKELIRDSLAIATAMAKNSGPGYLILDTMTGDLNRDGYVDLLMVLENDEKFAATDEPRPLLVLIGTKDGEMKLVAENDSVVMCRECGGVFGDPYDGLAIKNGYFSVQAYGGSAWRWSKIVTFKYNEEQKTWLLHRDGGVSYNIFEEEEIDPKEEFTNQDLYGKQKFEDYRVY